MAPLTITILITTYNYGPFLEQAVDSILAQDFPLEQVQILVVDDGSTDDTSERVKKYGSRVEYFYKANGGQASALNFGIARARGEIIALHDADDLFLPGKLRRISEAFEKDPALGMVYHRLREWHMETDERTDWDFPAISGYIHQTPDEFLLYVPHPTSAICLRRKSLSTLLPIPEHIRMLADCYLTALIPFLAPILAVPEFLAVYRIHGSNSYSATEQHIPTETRKSRLQMWQVVIDAMGKWLADNGYTRDQLPVRTFLDRWALRQESEQFQLKPPSRLHFFRHLQTYNSCYGPQMSRPLRIINYFNAYGALLTGYKHFYWLEVSRKKTVKLIRQIFNRQSTAT
jgi:glycosyltransferase involved in cell wall biosynthesis